MERIAVRVGGGESVVLVGSGILSRIVETLDAEGLRRPAAVVSNATVGPLYGRDLAAMLALPEPLELPDGEQYKRWPQVERCCTTWLTAGVHRAQSVLAVGGGVLTDTVGFAAAVFQRGIAWIAAPTTLLAMVDASVGGKTGVNLEVGKNLVGAFWQPRLVLADVSTLGTLPARELRAGMAEILKAAWIADHDLLERSIAAFEKGPGASTWDRVIADAVRIKAEVVAADERESGPRKALNLGHTLGHALEATTGYQRFVHGEAVVWGMRAVARIAARRGLLSTQSRERLERALAHISPLPAISDLNIDAVLQHLGRDKKLDDQGIAWVLPTDDGVLLDQRVLAEEITTVFAELQRTSQR